MLRPSFFRLSGGRAEAAIAMLSFGGSNLYWLALAFSMTPAAYGAMMTLQAAVLIVVMIFTFRTHDLFFNLIVQHDCPADLAYRRTLKIELTAGAAGALICTLTALAIEPTGGGATDAAGLAAFALLASLGVIHGASIGKLRLLTRGDIISKTDLLTTLAWAGACASIPLLRDQPAVVPLIIGSAPPAIRTITLLFAVRRLLPGRAADGPPPVQVGGGQILRFLAGAQLTNFLKNASVSIETLILAVFVPPAAVAMYRVVRAGQGASNAALNVVYQRFYPTLARAKTPSDRALEVRRLALRSVAICVAMYPALALVSAGYALFKPDIGMIEMQLITAGAFLAVLPSAIQQGAFAVLTLANDHRSAGTAYVLYVLVLAAASLLLLLLPRVEIFIVSLIGASLVRLWYLNARSHKALETLPAPQDRRDDSVAARSEA